MHKGQYFEIACLKTMRQIEVFLFTLVKSLVLYVSSLKTMLHSLKNRMGTFSTSIIGWCFYPELLRWYKILLIWALTMAWPVQVVNMGSIWLGKPARETHPTADNGCPSETGSGSWRATQWRDPGRSRWCRLRTEARIGRCRRRWPRRSRSEHSSHAQNQEEHTTGVCFRPSRSNRTTFRAWARSFWYLLRHPKSRRKDIWQAFLADSDFESATHEGYSWSNGHDWSGQRGLEFPLPRIFPGGRFPWKNHVRRRKRSARWRPNPESRFAGTSHHTSRMLRRYFPYTFLARGSAKRISWYLPMKPVFTSWAIKKSKKPDWKRKSLFFVKIVRLRIISLTFLKYCLKI